MYRRSADSDIFKATHYVCVVPKSRSEVTLTNLHCLNQKIEISKSGFFQTCQWKTKRCLSASQVNLRSRHKLDSLGHKNKVGVTTVRCMFLPQHCVQQLLALIILSCISQVMPSPKYFKGKKQNKQVKCETHIYFVSTVCYWTDFLQTYK